MVEQQKKEEENERKKISEKGKKHEKMWKILLRK